MTGFRSFWRPSAAAAATARKPPPAFLRQRSSTIFIVTTVSVAVFTDIFLYGLIVPVMPFALTVRSGVAEDDVQRWNAILFACYGIALLAGSPVAGLYADHTSSRRLPLMFGLVALAGATLLLCLGRSLGLLVTGRLLQGASAAIVWSVGLALLADTMGRRMGMAMAYVSIAMSAGLLLAPLIGGAVYAGAGYYAVYYVAFGLIALDIVMRLLLIERKVARQWEKEEATATTDEEAVDDNAPMPGADRPVPTDTISRQHTHNTMPLGTPSTEMPPPIPISVFRRMWLLLRVRRIAAALFASVIMASIVTAFDTVVPLFVEDEFGWGSTASGLLFFAPYLPPVLLSPAAGLLADRWGAKWPAVTGFVLAVPLLVCLRFVDRDTLGKKVLLAALLSLLGVMITVSNVPVMAEISFAIEAEEATNPGIWGPSGVYGIGYGLFTTAFALGSSIGSLGAGYLQADVGWVTMSWCLAVWSAAGAVVVFLWVGRFRLGREGGTDGEEKGDGGAHAVLGGETGGAEEANLGEANSEKPRGDADTRALPENSEIMSEAEPQKREDENHYTNVASITNTNTES